MKVFRPTCSLADQVQSGWADIGHICRRWRPACTDTRLASRTGCFPLLGIATHRVYDIFLWYVDNTRLCVRLVSSLHATTNLTHSQAKMFRTGWILPYQLSWVEFSCVCRYEQGSLQAVCNLYKKFELMLTRHAKAYSSYWTTTVK